MKTLILCISFTIALFLFACENSNPVKPGNQSPVINSIIVDPEDIDWGSECSLVVSAKDPEGKMLSYLWTSNDGEFLTSPDRDSVVWRAPRSSGNFLCSVEVSNGKKRSVKSVNLSVNEHPQLNIIQKEGLNFGTLKDNLTFAIVNSGTGSLEWRITEDESWLEISPINGAVVTDTAQITISVDRNGLAEGEYHTQINIDSNGGSTVLDISMEIRLGEWLSYDDDYFENGFTVGSTGWLWMRFSRPTDWSSAVVTKVQIYVMSGSSYEFDIDGFDDYTLYRGDYYPSGSYSNLKSSLRQSTGWHTYDVNHTFSSKEFFIAIWCTSKNGPHLGLDTSTTSADRCGGIVNGYNLLIEGALYGIRVFVEPAGSLANNNGDQGHYIELHHYEKEGMWLDTKFGNMKNYETTTHELNDLTNAVLE